VGRRSFRVFIYKELQIEMIMKCWRLEVVMFDIMPGRACAVLVYLGASLLFNTCVVVVYLAASLLFNTCVYLAASLLFNTCVVTLPVAVIHWTSGMMFDFRIRGWNHSLAPDTHQTTYLTNCIPAERVCLCHVPRPFPSVAFGKGSGYVRLPQRLPGLVESLW